MQVHLSVWVGVGMHPMLAVCRCPFVISNMCQWRFQTSYWADWTDQRVCNSPSTICCSLNSPLLWCCTQNEGLCLLPFYLKAPLVTHIYGLGSGKCHLKAYAVTFCLNNISGKYVYSTEKVKYSTSGCEHDTVFLKWVTPGLYMLFWFGCGPLYVGCILKPLWNYMKSSQAGY